MIVIHKRNDHNDYEPILAYDADDGEMWGLPRPWEANLDLVGLSEEDFAEYFPPPNYLSGSAEEDPFGEVPNAELFLRNYPPGSEDIPDVPTRNALGYGEDSEEGEEGKADAAEKAADAALSVFDKDEGDSPYLSKEEYERVDDALHEMHKRMVWWDGDDLDKAPPAWDSDEDLPEYVKESIREVIDEGILWDKFEGYSRQAAKAIHNSLEENLTQPQGWSVGSIVDDILEMYSGMSKDKALNIAQTELGAVFNRARERAYEKREDSDNYVFYWQGPSDHRTTDVCKEIKQEVESRGGSVPMEELRSILRTKAKKYAGTREGGTPERVDSWVPHYQCRHSMVRDVRSTL